MSEILEDNLIHSTRELCLERRFALQKGNDIKTQSNSYKEMASRQQSECSAVAESKLNPVKNFWLDLKRVIRAGYPYSPTKLEKFCKDEFKWPCTDMQVLQTYLCSLTVVIWAT